MKFLKKLACIILALSAVCSLTVFPAGAVEEPAVYGAGTVNTNVLSIRAEAAKASDILGTVSKDTVVIIEEELDDWFRILYDGISGYVPKKHITDITKAESFAGFGVVTGSDVPYRTGAGENFEEIDVLTAGDTVRMTGYEDGWYKILVGGATGYIKSNSLSLIDSFVSGNTLSDYADTQKIIELALSFVGSRYVYGGSSPSTGFDCSGFVYYLFGTCGHKVTRTVSTQYASDGYFVDRDEMVPGDLVFFAEGGELQHVGIYIGDNQFVHAANSRKGVIITDLDSAWYGDTYCASKRVIG